MSSRQWSLKSYVQLVRDLRKRKRAVLLIGSDSDGAVIEKIDGESEGCLKAVGLSLGRAAALMAACRVVVCHDSGAMHIAAAVGTPVVTIFGPTDPRRKAPRNKGSRTLWKGDGRCERCDGYSRTGNGRG